MDNQQFIIFEINIQKKYNLVEAIKNTTKNIIFFLIRTALD